MKNPSEIKNKEKRQQVYAKLRAERTRTKLEEKKRRKKLEDANPELKDQRLKANIPRTIENTKEYQEAIVDNDDEVFADEDSDEFADFFSGARGAPKICVTTNMRPSKDMHVFAKEFAHLFPTAEVRKRGTFEIKKIIEFCKEREYTDLVVLHEDKKQDGPNAALFIHLPDGPTAYFKLSNIVLPQNIKGDRPSNHTPEVILNHFNTRLGHTIGRYFASLFPPVPEFMGRQVVTFHNQRDFIFVRRHRYVFESKEKCKLVELGPRFTMKLRWLQKGTFDSKHGDYEWSFAQKMETSRRKFFL
ncbi:anticodon-binding protein [Catenaria anguillulae PL171]|uniref:Anticodon-binding protein n=1 Tax=Catenaria anguillulae PL171 TaxID=765915 RepID=A0A1Y2HXB0_9FUNG|nr:anticodon-binding protein [Catenaria anguillulae PL171]